MNRKKTNMAAVMVLAVIVLVLAGVLVYSGLRYQQMAQKLQSSQEELDKLQEKVDSQEEELAKDDTQEQQMTDPGTAVETETQPEDSQRESSQESAQQAAYATVMDIDAGMKIRSESVDMNHLSQYFMSSEIPDEVYQRINGRSYQENPNIALSDLRYLKMLHYNYDHQIQVGEMIVNAQIADEICSIFQELFENEYEIYSMYLVDNYWAGDGDSSDYASIDVNNTSAFNYREQTGGGALSNHAYGCAIDINPMENPYVVYDGDTPVEWAHSNADPYIDRTSGAEHVITHDDLCYQIFAKYGYSWGGDWSNPKDYQHFEKRLYG